MPQPIDMQTELGRVTAADRIQQIADRTSLAAQQRAAEQAEQERVEHESQIQETPETRQDQVDAEGRGRNPAANRRKRNRNKEEETQKKSTITGPDDLEPHQLNVRI